MFYSPEMFQKKDEDYKVRGTITDIWALGVTFYYLITGTFPFEASKNAFLLREMVLNQPINFDIIKNDKLRDLMTKILEKDPTKRWTIS